MLRLDSSLFIIRPTICIGALPAYRIWIIAKDVVFPSIHSRAATKRWRFESPYDRPLT